MIVHAHHAQLEANDAKIEIHNAKFMAAFDKLSLAEQKCAQQPSDSSRKKLATAQKAFKKLVDASSDLEGGSGKVQVMKSRLDIE